mgnify:CR=1 FL=1
MHFASEELSETEVIKTNLERAVASRKHLSTSENEIFRLTHAEGDMLPGLIIDSYKNHLVIQCYSWGMYRLRKFISQCLLELLPDTISIYDKSKESLHSDTIENEHLFGSATDCIAKEHGINYKIDWINGQKTGFFIDQRNNRALLGSYAKGKSLLNTFCYSGGFSLAALQNGATKVASLDSSADAIAILENNLSLNHFEGEHESIVSDTLDYLKNADISQYDIVVLDPPAYSKNRNTRHKAVQAYKRLNAMTIKKMKKGALLFTFSCSQVVDKALFYNTIVAAGIESQRQLKVLHQLHQPECHPININHPEGEYLKGLVLQVE